MRVILPNRPYRMDEKITEANVKVLLARINCLASVDKVSITKFEQLDFYSDILFEVEYSIFGKDDRLIHLNA